MSTSASVATLLQQLVTLPDICLVIGPDEAICELFVDPATMDFCVDGDFVTMENGPWHIHLDATKVHKITFVITPDTAQQYPAELQRAPLRRAEHHAVASVLSGYVRRTCALRPERVQQYEALRAYGDGEDMTV